MSKGQKLQPILPAFLLIFSRGQLKMDFLTLLRKLGIIRYGKKKYTYTSGEDMPVEALMDDVYDPEKDLVAKEDLKEMKEKFTRKKK